jgi:hypothetical protein
MEAVEVDLSWLVVARGNIKMLELSFKFTIKGSSVTLRIP